MRVTLTPANGESTSSDLPLQAALAMALIEFNANTNNVILTIWGDSGNILGLHSANKTLRFEANNAEKHVITYLASALNAWNTTRQRSGRPRRKPSAAELVGQLMQRRAGLSPADTRLNDLTPHELARVVSLVGHQANAEAERIFAML